MAKRRDADEEPTFENLEAITESLLRAAAQLPEEVVDEERLAGLLEAGRPDLAWEMLREAAGEQAVPFGFWVEMSRATDLMGIE